MDLKDRSEDEESDSFKDLNRVSDDRQLVNDKAKDVNTSKEKTNSISKSDGEKTKKTEENSLAMVPISPFKVNNNTSLNLAVLIPMFEEHIFKRIDGLVEVGHYLKCK